jgi:chemotaxis protein histidine kinase CheA
MNDNDFESLYLELSDRLEDLLLLVEAGNADEVRRQLHSLKGLAKAFGLDAFAAAVHAAEDMPAHFADRRVMGATIGQLFTLLEAA